MTTCVTVCIKETRRKSKFSEFPQDKAVNANEVEGAF